MFRRGFKAWCEQIAAKLRRDNGLALTAPLPPAVVANGMGVRLIPAEQLAGVPPDVLKRLLGQHRSVWSAVTISAGERHLVVYNSAHSKARQSNDLMHELSHLLLKHSPNLSFMDPSKGLLIRSYDKNQEDEANWLSAALLLPRQALVVHRSRHTPTERVCEIFGVSRDLLNFRTNTTGVERQLARRRAMQSRS
jgi:uncharacterized protein DUF955